MQVYVTAYPILMTRLVSISATYMYHKKMKYLSIIAVIFNLTYILSIFFYKYVNGYRLLL